VRFSEQLKLANFRSRLQGALGSIDSLHAEHARCSHTRAQLTARIEQLQAEGRRRALCAAASSRQLLSALARSLAANRSMMNCDCYSGAHTAALTLVAHVAALSSGCSWRETTSSARCQLHERLRASGLANMRLYPCTMRLLCRSSPPRARRCGAEARRGGRAVASAAGAGGGSVRAARRRR
jgi:hypothetical protein